jgi:hypothetical protein
MIQHMVALSIAERVPGTRISRVHLPEWGMDEPDLLELPAPIEVVNGNRFAIEEVAARLRSGETGTAEIRGYVQNINNFLPVDVYRNYFVSTADVEGFGPDELLISLRTAEVLSANFPPYVLLPISFYREMIDQTGLKPVFFGQLSDSPYLDSLRAAFPEARFVHGAGIIHDFEKIRRSRNILLSVSTFAWCAAWMSHADRIIMPLTGLFNPVFAEFRCGGIDLIPKTDPRYEFYLFPINVAVPQEELTIAHAALDGRWRKIDAAGIDAIWQRRKEVLPVLQDHLALFDEQFYLHTYPDLGRLVAGGYLSSGRDHYAMHGFSERRLAFEVDETYLYRCPEGAMGISDGSYLDLVQFHAERGRHLGIAPVSPAAERKAQGT